LREGVDRPWQTTHAVRTGDTLFNHVFGMDVWTYRPTHPDFSSFFNEAMQSLTQGTMSQEFLAPEAIADVFIARVAAEDAAFVAQRSIACRPHAW
jgi:hypothetical protein